MANKTKKPMTVEELDGPLFDTLDELEALGFALKVSSATKDGNKLRVRVEGRTRQSNVVVNEMFVTGLKSDAAGAWRAAAHALYDNFDMTYALKEWSRLYGIVVKRDSDLGRNLCDDFEYYRKYDLVKLVKAFDRMAA